MSEVEHTPRANMDDLYARDTTPVTRAESRDVASQRATAANTTSVDATASRGEATMANVTPEMDVDQQVNRITSQDSSYIKGARQGGMLSAASRGLQNSSLAAGAAEREAVRAALPMAQQNAQQNFNRSLADQQASNDMSRLNAQLETAVNQGNAEAANAIRARMAELETSVSTFNAGEANKVNTLNAERGFEASRFNAGAQNERTNNILSLNTELNRQFLSGTQAMDLATIQGRFNQLISTSETAGRLYQAYVETIGQAMQNTKMTPEKLSGYVYTQQRILDAGLRTIDTINSTDLSRFAAPGAGQVTTGLPPQGSPPPGATTGLPPHPPPGATTIPPLTGGLAPEFVGGFAPQETLSKKKKKGLLSGAATSAMGRGR